MARPEDKSPIHELPGGQATYYEMFMQLWMGWTAVFCILSFLSGVGVSYYVFQGTCDDVSDAATWNLIAAWRSLRAASMNPILAMLSPQTTQAAGVATVSLITLGAGVVGRGLKKYDIDVGTPMGYIHDCSQKGRQILRGAAPPAPKRRDHDASADHMIYPRRDRAFETPSRRGSKSLAEISVM